MTYANNKGSDQPAHQWSLIKPLDPEKSTYRKRRLWQDETDLQIGLSPLYCFIIKVSFLLDTAHNLIVKHQKLHFLLLKYKPIIKIKESLNPIFYQVMIKSFVLKNLKPNKIQVNMSKYHKTLIYQSIKPPSKMRNNSYDLQQILA